ncbi:tRNA (guanosine(46)-N7)-methyltransferase TrmB [Reinekea blandensis]|uniref:tRNA (guanine-N(7)-)-methyltransferase n=1 Tax=Reinekea blandensis MED297 TaxID=314283 RepID=A4BAJ8_9GAMM|nr:tRNA (guanosine(46)-N7)-methyltransferase TrmB [Reinekea blandensis]EAR10954.1 tRNA (guanine-N(7)-)-methyltransferase [Reinekea sp. MED297] [Reinekea blandensis MED297]
MIQSEQPFQRKIRSFVMRAARMTDGQKKSLERNWAEFGLSKATGPLDLTETFGRDADTVLEIGFGMGDSLVDMALAAPDKNFIGIEVHLPGVGRMLNRTESEGLTNIRCYKDDAVEVLSDCIADASLSTVQLFFPDPWHKKKHHKRRIVQPEFAQLIRRKLKTGGTFHLATDWENYAEHMLEVMDAAEGFENTAGQDHYLPERPAHRPVTKFEKRGQKLGHGVWDLIYQKTS